MTGTNAVKRFLVRSLTGVGTIAAATVGVQSGLGVNDTISNNVLLRERLADNVALAGDQQLAELGYRQNIVVTVPGNTRFLHCSCEIGRGSEGASSISAGEDCGGHWVGDHHATEC